MTRTVFLAALLALSGPAFAQHGGIGSQPGGGAMGAGNNGMGGGAMHGGDIGGFRSGSMYPGNAMGSGWHGDSDMGHHGGGGWAAAGATTIGIWAAMAGGTIAIRRDGFVGGGGGCVPRRTSSNEFSARIKSFLGSGLPSPPKSPFNVPRLRTLSKFAMTPLRLPAFARAARPPSSAPPSAAPARSPQKP